MANEENLIPYSERSVNEARENGKKGGKASGKARRKKKQEKDRLKLLLSLKLMHPKMYDLLLEMGVDEAVIDNETGIELSLIVQALKGDISAIKYIDERTGKNPALELRKSELALKRDAPDPNAGKNENDLITSMKQAAEALNLDELDTSKPEADGGDELVDDER